VPSFLILLPFLSIIVLNLPIKSLMPRIAFKLAGCLALFQVFVVILQPAGFWNFSFDPLARFFVFGSAADNLSRVTLLSIGIVVFISLLVAKAMLVNEGQRFNFVNLTMLAMLGMNVIVVAADIFSIYVFIEVTALASFILIALTKDQLAIEGAFKYIILSAVATVLMLCSIGLLLLFSGGTSFESVAFALRHSGNAFLLKASLGLFLCGLFIKSGLVPFHGWLPDAYSAASSPVSILLAGIVTKVSGVYVLLRLMISVFGGIAAIHQALMFIGAISIIIGAFLALTQNNFKRLLAYSSISQVGYIILAAGCATPLAILGALFHFFNHATFKSLLFVNAASLEKQTGSVDMDKMGGVANKMPVTGITSVIAFLSTAGIPPLSGFWSKLIIVIALWNSGNIIYASIAILASVITLGYLLYLQRQVFFGKLNAGLEGIKEVGIDLLAPQLILTIIIVVVGVFTPWILKCR
jgi:proton-translocating NADH-quinone oxidoreductase chain N